MPLMPFAQAREHLLTTSWEKKTSGGFTNLYSSTTASAESPDGYPHIHIKYDSTQFKYIGITYGALRSLFNVDLVVNGVLKNVNLSTVEVELSHVKSATQNQRDMLKHVLFYIPAKKEPEKDFSVDANPGDWPTLG
ncbi:hypothetical protein [Sagittula stellata]|nr:hypothetical protein [Sagittula stellata]